jgi:glycosyltransferase involved in cell wall biosynthesis
MLVYPQWLERRIAVRSAEYPTRDTSFSFSLLTTVYERSDAVFLSEAARSIFTQSYQAFEWILLAQGAVSPSVESVLAEIETHPQCRVLRHERNLGIIPGLQRCLSTATGDYLIPFDADDLLTSDALQIMAHSISRHKRPALVYSDEDRLVEGNLCTPYLRPDWDPVLALSSSYIWHLCAIDRAAALELGVYSDAGANWCHDWDTVLRFAATGKRIVHVPEVLYHWRQHAASSTNRPDPESGSLHSQRHVLERWVDTHPDPELFSVEKFPIDRDAAAYWIARRNVSPPALALLAYGGNPSLLMNTVCSVLGSASGAVSEIHLVGIPDLPVDMRGSVARLTGSSSTRIIVWPQARPYDLLLALSNSHVTAVAVVSQNVTVKDDWVWEADRLLRLHPKLALIAARILDDSGVVLSAGQIFGFGGISGSPDAGRSETEPGPYGIALKPRSVSAPHPWFFVARRANLVEGLRALPAQANWPALGTWLGGVFAETGGIVAFSPTLNAFRQTSEPIDALVEAAEARAFAHRFIRFIPDFRGYSKWYCWTPSETYKVRSAGI